jgi:2Fe-2S ferredoxin
MSVKVVFIQRNGSRKEIQAEEGTNLMLAARGNGIDIEGTCEGVMACSTCHVIVDPAWAKRLPPPSGEETDMLELAAGLAKTSRLGCQIKLVKDLDGLTVSLPQS